MSIRGLKVALNGNGRFKYKSPELVVDHLVVGAGVVGLAIAQRLCEKFPSKSTYVVERHSRAGEETSSRNSEVIHSGLYYPPGSLKTRLCLRGRDMTYERCQKLNIPHRKTGKLVVATSSQQSYIQNLYTKSLRLTWPPHSQPVSPETTPVLPTRLISGDEARSLEPELSKDISAALWCPETGILDSHAFMESLEKDIIDTDGGELAYGTRVVRVDRYQHEPSGDIPDGEQGWVVQTLTGNASSDTESDAFLVRTLINASGLSGPFILNSLLPSKQRIPIYYARGSYASYKGPGTTGVSHLIYPCPYTGPNAHAFESLGTHLTLDLNSKIRFGPDLEWISPPVDLDNTSEDAVDFWMKHLVPSDSRLGQMHQAVTQYLSGVQLEGMQPDYVGIRPKLVPPGGGFQDFVFHTDYASDGCKDGNKEKGPMVSLLGIESPGLTSSLAIAEYVVEDLLGKE
ncbi:pyridine nucleotide disulfide oxidoreductase-like protein [Dendrothele bispora CBS 962.96]|uniref:L-2-hydroxyglutarate dehydrogenase, mitochondrial n=1 Tax=Dendrothele bispora (strain CBS 962.96) TaxID=1314807 RepID=A0A4S8MQS5_DENBC|nr:pyridine nucleotide disulfide oxidoreductase-like protein [Dendrothele bispora CBS 962.96]